MIEFLEIVTVFCILFLLLTYLYADLKQERKILKESKIIEVEEKLDRL